MGLIFRFGQMTPARDKEKLFFLDRHQLLLYRLRLHDLLLILSVHNSSHCLNCQFTLDLRTRLPRFKADTRANEGEKWKFIGPTQLWQFKSDHFSPVHRTSCIERIHSSNKFPVNWRAWFEQFTARLSAFHAWLNRIDTPLTVNWYETAQDECCNTQLRNPVYATNNEWEPSHVAHVVFDLDIQLQSRPQNVETTGLMFHFLRIKSKRGCYNTLPVHW